jgi:folate-binding protein YgfZ
MHLPKEKIPGVIAGWQTALSFGDPESEFRAAMNGSAVVDSSMCGRLEVTGADRLDLLHRLSTNSLSGLTSGSATATVFVTDKGRVIDRVIVAVRGESLLLITSPGAESFLVRWIEKYTIREDITFRDVTADTVMASLIGSRMIAGIFPKLHVSPGTTTSSAPEGQETDLLIVRCNDSSADIAYTVAPNDGALRLVSALESGPGARWIGERAYQGFRIARGIPARPAELNDAYNPLECGLRDSISFTKGCYIGQEVIARLDTYGKTRRCLVRITSQEPPADPLPVPVRKDGVNAGMLTSMTDLPFQGKFLGLAIVSNDAAAPGTRLEAGARDTGLTVADS